MQIDYLGFNYRIDKDGNIFNRHGKSISVHLSNSGYKYVCLKITGKSVGRFIHRALAIAFIPNPEGKEFVNHKDGNKLNNKLSNLEWCTRSENVQHAYNTGLKKYKPLHNKGKFGFEHNRSKSVVCENDGNIFGSMSEAERFYNLGGGSVSWSIKHKKPIYGMRFEIKE